MADNQIVDERIQDLPVASSVQSGDLFVIASAANGYNAMQASGDVVTAYVEATAGAYATQAQASATAAQQAQQSAAASAETATSASQEAAQTIDTIRGYATQAQEASQSASTAATNAAAAQTAAEASQTAAAASQSAAAQSATAAQSSAQSATTAQQGAEAAQAAAEQAAEQVQAIVAGNEAYTKQEANDRFALALQVTDGPAASLTIYPDEGSNMVITSQGFTVQEGSGAPSLNNVRPIKTGSVTLKKFVFDGSENWWNTPAGTSGLYRVGVDVPGLLMPQPNVVPNSKCDRYRVVSAEQTIGLITGLSHASTIPAIHIYDPKYSTSGTLALWKENLAKNPLTVWLEMADGSGDLYAPQIAQGENYQCNCLSLSTFLCQGNSISSDGTEIVESKLVKLLPSGWQINKQDETGTWFINYTLNSSFWQAPSQPNDRFCTHFPVGTATGANSTNVFSLGNGGGNINLKFLPDSISTVDELNQFLTENDVYVWGVLETTETVMHTPTPFLAAPATDGSVVVSGQNTVSATYNKSLARAFQELQTAIQALQTPSQPAAEPTQPEATPSEEVTT